VRLMSQILKLAFVCFSFPLLASPYETTQNQWITLFNGEDLQGWVPKITGQPLGSNLGGLFRVDNGLLRVVYEDHYTPFNNQFGHLFYETAFSHYALRIEYRFVDAPPAGDAPSWAVRNSGVMLHALAPHSMSLRQAFPTSIEVQFLGGLSDGKPRPTANLCTPGTHVEINQKLVTQHCIESTSDTYYGDDWVDLTIVVLGGGKISHWVEGKEVLAYHRPQLGEGDSATIPVTYLSQGYIALQSESYPIEFRTVELLNLVGCTNPNATNFKSYAVKTDNSDCRY